MKNVILEMKGITKAFAGVKALNQVNLLLHQGEIHALIGENGAGKSTLMKVLLGIHKCDSGEIIYDGEKVVFNDPADALKRGISMVHQEISLVQSMSVSENIWMGYEKKFLSMGLIKEAKRREATQKLLEKLKISISPDTKVNKLSVAYMQLIELARAVACNPKILILDEPTSALAESETKLLFQIVRQLAASGTAVIFISHKLDEIYEICEKITVLRDGEYIETRTSENLKKDELINLIVGREVTSLYHREPTPIGEVVLSVENLSSQGVFKDISFQVKKGEIVGFSGLMGAGRSEIMRAIFGIDKIDGGRIWINGKECKIKNPCEAVRLGIGMVTEDRLRTGVITTLSILYNSTLANLRKYTKMGLVNKKREREDFENYSKKLYVKFSSEKETINKLSGGNQQKVILSRWLMTNPQILILDEPTRGIDIGAKSEIYRLIGSLAEQGLAIIVVSSEMEELLNVCDRIYVVCNGRITCETDIKDATQELLAEKAFGA